MIYSWLGYNELDTNNRIQALSAITTDHVAANLKERATIWYVNVLIIYIQMTNAYIHYT